MCQLAALLLVASALRAEPAIMPSAASASLQAQVAREVSGTVAIDAPGYVGIDVNASILPLVVLRNGSASRSIWAHAKFLKGGMYLGEANFHQMVPADSRQVIDLSLTGVDINLGDRSPNAAAVLKSFDVSVEPARGKTWGEVTSFEGDVVVLASPR